MIGPSEPSGSIAGLRSQAAMLPNYFENFLKKSHYSLHGENLDLLKSVN